MRIRSGVVLALLLLAGCQSCRQAGSDGGMDASLRDVPLDRTLHNDATTVDREAFVVPYPDLISREVRTTSEIFYWNYPPDVVCFPMPDATQIPVLQDASCGDGCAFFSPYIARSTEAIDTPTGMRYSSRAYVHEYNPSANTLTNLWPGDRQRGVCIVDGQRLLTSGAAFRDGGGFWFTCTEGDDWTLFEVNDERTQGCSRYAQGIPYLND